MARTTTAISSCSITLIIVFSCSVATLAKAPSNWPLVKFDNAQ